MARILLVSPVPIYPTTGGNRERIRRLLGALQGLGHEVHLLYVTLEPDGDVQAMRESWGDRFHLFDYDRARTPNRGSPSFHRTPIGRVLRRALVQVGVNFTFPYSVDDWYDEEVGSHLRALQGRYGFEQVWLEYVFLAKSLLVLPPGVLKVVDTNDVFTDRHRRYRRQAQPAVWFSTTRREERKALRRADVIVAIQEEEARFFRQLVPDKRVVTVGHFIELCALPFKLDAPLELLFLASGNEANLHGLRVFLLEVLPRIRRHHPGVRLLLAGTVCRAVADDPSYSKLGEFTRAAEVYGRADIVVGPIPFGTGLKIKNMEALGFGKPLVTTPAGAEGIGEGAGSAFLVGRTAQEFATQVNALLADPELRRNTAERAYRFATAYRRRSLESLRSVLETDLDASPRGQPTAPP